MRLLESSLVRKVRQSPALRPPAIAAYRLALRVAPTVPGPKVIANSMPKSGTHLLASLFDEFEGMKFAGYLVRYGNDSYDPDKRMRENARVLRRLRQSRYVGGHLICDPRVEELLAKTGVKVVTILRDPRAVVVSGIHYVQSAPQLPRRELALAEFPTHESIVNGMVFGHGKPGDFFYTPEIGERFATYARWQESEQGVVVRFEDLVGPRGGGSEEAQVAAVSTVMDYLGYDAAQAPNLIDRLYSDKAITFRSGQIESWRAELSDDLVDEINRRCAEPMARLGYAP